MEGKHLGKYGKKKILLLGAGGFIGKNLKEYFLKIGKYDIIAPTRDVFDTIDEVFVRETLKSDYYDVIIHAAVYNPRVGAGKNQQNELENNLRMFYNFEKYQELYGKMLYFGSGAEFDKSNDISNVDENYAPINVPLNEYGLYKYIINKAIISSNNIVNLRIFGLFGKYENWTKTFISGACCKANKRLPITIRRNVMFDYLYVDDFVKIVEWFIDNDHKYKDYNITSGKQISLVEIADKIREISGNDIPIYTCFDGMGKEYSASNKRLLEEIGDFQFTIIDDALSELYEWYDTKQDEIDIYSLLYNNNY